MSLREMTMTARRRRRAARGARCGDDGLVEVVLREATAAEDESGSDGERQLRKTGFLNIERPFPCTPAWPNA